MKRTSEELLEFFGLKPFDMISIKKKDEFGEYEWSEWFELSDDWSSSNLVASILNMDYKFFRQPRKQVPLKPRYTIVYDEKNRWISANCGACDEYLPTTHPYCNGCGQRIDWNDEPDLTIENALKHKPQHEIKELLDEQI